MNQEKLQKANETLERIQYLKDRLKRIDEIISNEDAEIILNSGYSCVKFERKYLPKNYLEFISEYKGNVMSEIKRLEEEFDSI